MTEIEILTTWIGETTLMENEGVKDVKYTSEKDRELTAFTIVMESGKQYAVNVMPA